MNTYSLTQRFKRLINDEGGWVNLIPVGVSLLSKLFTGGAKSSAADRQAKDLSNSRADQLRVQEASNYERALQDRRDLEMRQRAADAAARQEGFKGALRAATIQQWQPAARPNGIPNISFVHKPQTEALPEYERQMMLRLLNGEKFDSLPAVQRVPIQGPAAPSTWEKISGGLGLGASVLDGLMQSGVFGKKVKTPYDDTEQD